jgi:hypothetical protein
MLSLLFHFFACIRDCRLILLFANGIAFPLWATPELHLFVHSQEFTCLSVEKPKHYQIYWTQTPILIKVNHLRQNSLPIPSELLILQHLLWELDQICAKKQVFTEIDSVLTDSVDEWISSIQATNPLIDKNEWILIPIALKQQSLMVLQKLIAFEAITALYLDQTRLWQYRQNDLTIDQINAFIDQDQATKIEKAKMISLKVDMAKLKRKKKRPAIASHLLKLKDPISELAFVNPKMPNPRIDFAGNPNITYQAFHLDLRNEQELIATFSFEYMIARKQIKDIEKHTQQLAQLPCLFGIAQDSRLIKLPIFEPTQAYLQIRGYQRCVYPISLIYQPFIILLSHSSLSSEQAEIDLPAIASRWSRLSDYPFNEISLEHFLSTMAFGQSDQRGSRLLYHRLPASPMKGSMDSEQAFMEWHIEDIQSTQKGLLYQPYPAPDQLSPVLQSKITTIKQRSIKNEAFKLKGILWSSQWFFEQLFFGNTSFTAIEIVF